MIKQHWIKKIPDGDDVERNVCYNCNYVAYENPKNVVGSVTTYQDKVLLCRRAIEPRKGYWTLPAGYMELGESTSEGAEREAFEEANAKIKTSDLLAIFELPYISQVQLFYIAELTDPNIKPGIESLEVKLFDWDDIPWNDLAFSTVHKALKQFEKVKNDKTIIPLREIIKPQNGFIAKPNM